MRDRLPNGFQFLDDGTAKAAFVSDEAPITSVTPSVSNPLNLGLGSPATFDSDLWIQGTDESTVTPTFVLPDPNIGSSRSIRGNDPDPDIYTPNKDVYFKFGDINNPDRDADDEYVIVEFNALVENRTNNNLSNNRQNSFSVNVGVGNNFNTERELARSNTINTRIVEPEITIDKKVNGNDTDTIPFRVDSGDTVTFTVTFSNKDLVNNATAFDLQMTDTLPSELNNLQIVSVISSNASVIGVVDNSVVASNEIIINVDELPKGESVTVTYTADVGGTVTPDRLIDNTATVTYTSLPGTGTANGDPGNATGSTTPGTSGADDGERDSSDGAGISPDDYITTDAGQLQAAPLIPAKTLVSTSEASTSNSDVTIGEIVRYRLAVQIPEGQIPNLQLEDLLPGGMVYLNDGTTKVAFIANDGGITSTTISGSGLQISGDAPVTPTLALTSSAIAEENPNSSFESGENPIFSLGDLTNADRDVDGEYVVIEFNALVENIIGNQDPNTLDNIFEVRATNATTRQSDPAVTINIVEPSIANVAKTVSTDGVNFAESVTGDAGDTLTFQVTFSNTGNTTAFDVNLTDSIADRFQNLSNIQIVDGNGNSAFSNQGNTTAFEVNLTDSLPAELENLVVSSIIIRDEIGNDVTGSFTTIDASTSTIVDVEINQLLKDYSAEVEYTADIINNIAPDTSIDNTVNVTYSSLPGDDTDGSSSTSPGTTSNPTDSDVNDLILIQLRQLSMMVLMPCKILWVYLLVL
ncbi:MAG: isopeptide-forming domain-containing fimbrial protein [Xenococcaceae cyanobacterium MO_188.B32]|nr:isopeptide-forming domain-containing fimbrial protein [Xenococcaceae cyanobacterium MO_188.B32]